MFPAVKAMVDNEPCAKRIYDDNHWDLKSPSWIFAKNTRPTQKEFQLSTKMFFLQFIH